MIDSEHDYWILVIVLFTVKRVTINFSANRYAFGRFRIITGYEQVCLLGYARTST